MVDFSKWLTEGTARVGFDPEELVYRFYALLQARRTLGLGQTNVVDFGDKHARFAAEIDEKLRGVMEVLRGDLLDAALIMAVKSSGIEKPFPSSEPGGRGINDAEARRLIKKYREREREIFQKANVSKQSRAKLIDKLTEIYFLLKTARDIDGVAHQIDRMLHVVHLDGNVLTELARYRKNGHFNWTQQALNFKRDASLNMLIDRANFNPSFKGRLKRMLGSDLTTIPNIADIKRKGPMAAMHYIGTYAMRPEEMDPKDLAELEGIINSDEHMKRVYEQYKRNRAYWSNDRVGAPPDE